MVRLHSAGFLRFGTRSVDIVGRVGRQWDVGIATSRGRASGAASDADQGVERGSQGVLEQRGDLARWVVTPQIRAAAAGLSKRSARKRLARWRWRKCSASGSDPRRHQEAGSPHHPGHRVTGNRRQHAPHPGVGNPGRKLGTAGWEFVQRDGGMKRWPPPHMEGAAYQPYVREL